MSSNCTRCGAKFPGHDRHDWHFNTEGRKGCAEIASALSAAFAKIEEAREAFVAVACRAAHIPQGVDLRTLTKEQGVLFHAIQGLGFHPKEAASLPLLLMYIHASQETEDELKKSLAALKAADDAYEVIARDDWDII